MYKVIGLYQGSQETLEDGIEDIDEAERLRAEYTLAFGAEWVIEVVNDFPC